MRSRDTFYAARWGSRRKGERRKSYQMHREIMQIGDDMLCDHINGNGLDNRKANLREATCAQNSWNSGKSRGVSRSKYKGPAWDKRYRKWEVRISVHGKRIYIGRFNDELEAARAYDAAAVKYHGRYASLNFKT